MLVLKLYEPDEFITIGDNVRVYARLNRGHVVLSIDAPEEIGIVRSTAKNKGAQHAKNRVPLPEL